MRRSGEFLLFIEGSAIYLPYNLKYLPYSSRYLPDTQFYLHLCEYRGIYLPDSSCYLPDTRFYLHLSLVLVVNHMNTALLYVVNRDFPMMDSFCSDPSAKRN